MNRDELIQLLLVETVHQIVENRQTGWLIGILEHGFAGFANLDAKGLAMAASRFGVDPAAVPDKHIPRMQDDATIDCNTIEDDLFARRYSACRDARSRDDFFDPSE